MNRNLDALLKSVGGESRKSPIIGTEAWALCPKVQGVFAAMPWCTVTSHELIFDHPQEMAHLTTHLRHRIIRHAKDIIEYHIIDCVISLHSVLVIIEFAYHRIVIYDPHGKRHARHAFYDQLPRNIGIYKVIRPDAFEYFQHIIDQATKIGSCTISSIFPVYMAVLTRRPIEEWVSFLVHTDHDRVRTGVLGMMALISKEVPPRRRGFQVHANSYLGDWPLNNRRADSQRLRSVARSIRPGSVGAAPPTHIGVRTTRASSSGSSDHVMMTVRIVIGILAAILVLVLVRSFYRP